MVTAIIDLLIADATVQGLVGKNRADGKYKVYPVIAPQQEKAPYIVVRQTSKGRPGKGCDFFEGVSITSFHKSYDDVVALDSAVLAAVEIDNNILTGTNDSAIIAEGGELYLRTTTIEQQ